MKKIIILIMIILLTGCGAKYQIKITDSGIEEKINVQILANNYNYEDAESIDINSVEAIESLKETNLTVLTNSNDIFYKKNITNEGNLYNIDLSYKYSKEQFNYSRVMNECFENHEYSYNDKKTYIHLYGAFYCYDNENIDIVVKSDYVVNKANGNKKGNEYQWTIDDTNYNNVDIEIEVSNKSKIRNNIYTIILIVFGIGLVVFAIYFIGKFAGRDSVNEI